MDINDVVLIVIAGGFALIAVLAITYYLWRWIFSIKRQLWNQKQQINLLWKIAEKLGVDMEEDGLRTMKYQNNDPDNSNLK